MPPSYDAVVVGARCAGSPTAMLLARQGHRVLVVDRATFPSDTMSTHLVHAPGLAALERWGLLDSLVASAMTGFVSAIASTIPVPEFFGPANVQRIMGAAGPATTGEG